MTEVVATNETILVVGGGISGMTAALEAAETGNVTWSLPESRGPYRGRPAWLPSVCADDHEVVYQADYGLLNASACVRAHVRLAQAHGAVLVEQAKVVWVSADAHSATVTTTDAVYTAARLVITAGAFLLPSMLKR